MTGLELRPLSLGEILDRTFTLYRRYFLLFLGISAIPQLLVLAFQLVQDEFPQTGALNLVMLAVLMIISLLSYLFAQAEPFWRYRSSIWRAPRRWRILCVAFGTISDLSSEW
jgi:hypothetical protein